MTAPSVHAGPVRWDTAAITARLQRRYRVPVWWDDRNAAWMAMVLRPTGHPAGDQVVAAVTPAGLERCLAAAGVRPVSQPRQAPGPRPVPVRVRRAVHGRHEAPRSPLWRRLVGVFVQLDDDEW
ncbi:hypothetical protein Acsp04_63840 [Actinomadura sp. NBRC 104425]|uniref:hypothetical protein n=1 Tax=Actinomadura sp. NBRC 104425 TaxID=3032204 RepID=UPI0024A300A8|nr:hypothetical protein [Actinomadura sp. NBRC 104425]GLZ16149.1 hypothetical protein Acsp04_63840 [Actinomadura sp. NBRC 104425]